MRPLHGTRLIDISVRLFAGWSRPKSASPVHKPELFR